MTQICDAHSEFSERIARIEENTQQTLIAISRLEERVYQDHGMVSTTVGSVKAAIKVAGVSAAIAAATAAAINLISG